MDFLPLALTALDLAEFLGKVLVVCLGIFVVGGALFMIIGGIAAAIAEEPGSCLVLIGILLVAGAIAGVLWLLVETGLLSGWS